MATMAKDSPSPVLREAARRYGEVAFGEVRGRIYELTLDEESGLHGICDTQAKVYDGQEFVVVSQWTRSGTFDVMLNAKQIMALAEIVGKP